MSDLMPDENLVTKLRIAHEWVTRVLIDNPKGYIDIGFSVYGYGELWYMRVISLTLIQWGDIAVLVERDYFGLMFESMEQKEEILAILNNFIDTCCEPKINDLIGTHIHIDIEVTIPTLNVAYKINALDREDIIGIKEYVITLIDKIKDE